MIERMVVLHVCVHKRHSCGLNYHLRIDARTFGDSKIKSPRLRRPDLTSKTRTGTNTLHSNEGASLWWCVGRPRDGLLNRLRGCWRSLVNEENAQICEGNACRACSGFVGRPTQAARWWGSRRGWLNSTRAGVPEEDTSIAPVSLSTEG